MFMRHLPERRKKVALLIVGSLLLVGAFVATRPVISDVSYRFTPGTPWNAASFPLIVEGAPPGPFSVEFKLQAGWLHPWFLYFAPDDCVDTVWVNGKMLTDGSIPFCDFRIGTSLNLSRSLVVGENTITLDMRNLGWPAGLDVSIPPHDPLTLLFVALWCVFVVLLFGMHTIRRWMTGASARRWLNTQERAQCIAFFRSALLVLVFFGLLRGMHAVVIRALYELQNPYTADLSLYLALGRGILNGLTPYTDLFENKPPAMFFLSALSLKLFDGPQLLHMLEAVILIGFPYAFLVWHMVRSPFSRKDLRKPITIFLLANTAFFAMAVGLYTMLRSGEAQVESYGAFLGTLFLLLIAGGKEKFPRQNVAAASVLLLGAIMFKEPFLLTILAGAMVLSRGDVRELWSRFAIPLCVAGALGVTLMLVLGYFGPYVTIYLGEMFGHHIPQSGSPAPRVFAWHRVWEDVRDFSPGLLWSMALMLGYSFFPRRESMRHLIDVLVPLAVLALAFSFTSFAVGMTRVYFNHHFIFAVPLYSAIFLRFMLDIRQDRSRAATVVLWGNTLLLTSAMFTHTTMNYDRLLSIFAKEPIPAKQAAAVIDDVLDACGIEQYMFLGGNGPQPYGFTKHSPMGPLFMQYGYSLSPDRTFFRSEFLRTLGTAQLVVQESYILSDLHDDVTAYLEREFTTEPLGCATAAMRPGVEPYVFHFRK
jgi:hypothetical protein